jgi:hypothetical protein
MVPTTQYLPNKRTDGMASAALTAVSSIRNKNMPTKVTVGWLQNDQTSGLIQSNIFLQAALQNKEINHKRRNATGETNTTTNQYEPVILCKDCPNSMLET